MGAGSAHGTLAARCPSWSRSPRTPPTTTRRALPPAPGTTRTGSLEAAERKLEAELHERYPQADLTAVTRAYAFAVEAHAPQLARQR